ncbi:PBP1A family penicillin-binding protein [Moraxella nasibovis]|uniref:penicillin-binding protein 1A n=1 Tax=Moraxella nasibovis TaxID=2904120 RepID=UPI00240F050E|nr:PBP1A family penicillin-binding protein [Moraxella nasibovis]WFF38270.1 PBP1A family penicillin-binding protein [Moraxella nasibovis]
MTKTTSNANNISLLPILLRILGAIVALILILVLAFPIGFYGMAMYLQPNLPDLKNIDTSKFEMPLQIYTADNKLIGQYGNRFSMPVTYEQIPKQLINAFLAAEDSSFFEHSGISVKGIGRALTEVVTNDDTQTGGSTITMQVAKNYFLSAERTLDRKLTELFIARKIENEMSKDEILTLYVNKIYLGEGAYGVAAAARKYFSKTLDELTIAEMAMIAGLPKAPSAYNPVVNPERALIRRNWIIGRMLEDGHISQAEHDEAVQAPIGLHLYREKLDLNMPYLAEMARNSLVEKYGESVMDSGWRVQMTVSSDEQIAAEQALIAGLRNYDTRHGNGWQGAEAESGDLNNFLNYDNMYPAQVTKVTGSGFEAKIQSGDTIQVAWSGGMNWARRLLEPGKTGGYFSAPSQMVQVGNIVRVTPLNEEKTAWRLTQPPSIQGALVSIHPENGAVRALVGGFNFNHSKFNRATQGYRQPGSIIKPLIYAAALETGKFTPSSLVSDAAISIGGWQPKNADGRYTGDMPVRRALALSRNTPSIRLLRATGLDYARQTLDMMGLEKERLPATLALALGAADATPLQMATGFATLVNGGHRVQPYFIERIYDFNNQTIFQANPVQACAVCFNEALDKLNASVAKSFEESKNQATDTTQTEPAFDTKGSTLHDRLQPKTPAVYANAQQAPRVISQKTAYEMAGMLREVITSGTARKALALGRSDVGGKTGTTNQAKDAWFAGVHPTSATIVWVGFDNPAPMGANEYGGVAALPIWMSFTREQLRGTPVRWVSANDRSKAEKETQHIINLTDDVPSGQKITN